MQVRGKYGLVRNQNEFGALDLTTGKILWMQHKYYQPEVFGTGSQHVYTLYGLEDGSPMNLLQKLATVETED